MHSMDNNSILVACIRINLFLPGAIESSVHEMKNMIHISSWIISSVDIQWMLWIETGLLNNTCKLWLIITAYILIHLPYLKNEVESANDTCNIFTWNNILNTLTKFIIRQETPSIRITINFTWVCYHGSLISLQYLTRKEWFYLHVCFHFANVFD